MKKAQNLRIPGPTPLPPETLKAGSLQMISHRAPFYEKMQSRITKNLQYFFQTKNDVFLLTSSGMGGLEAAVANFFSPKDKIVSFTCGDFGNRWADVARRFGASVTQIKFDIGKSVDPNVVSKTLKKHKKIQGVFITHNETATGVLNDIRSLAKIVKSHSSKPLLLIDSISALGSVNLPMDKWNLDVVVSASQKGWMAPPGLSFIAVSPQAWRAHKTAKMPRYYFDISSFRDFAKKNQTPATPAVSVLFALYASLQNMRKEGKEKIFSKHLKLMEYCRKCVRKLGLTLYVSDACASPTVTSIKIPKGVDGHKWLVLMREKYNTVLAGGMGEAKGKIIRIAHMGYVSKKDIDEAIKVLEKSLKEIR